VKSITNNSHIRDIEEGGVREVNEDDKIRILNHLSSLGFIIDVELFSIKDGKIN